MRFFLAILCCINTACNAGLLDAALFKCPQRLKQLLVTNPAAAHLHLSSVSLTLRNPANANPRTLMAAINSLERRNPFFLLHECTSSNNGQCALSRYANPHYRETFERLVVSDLKKECHSTNKVACMSFGSGGLFQDLVILTKFLRERPPQAKIDLHVADIDYLPFVAWLDTSSSRQITASTLIGVDEVLSKLHEISHLLGREGSAESLAIRFVIFGRLMQQFAHCIEFMFPQAELRLFAHHGLGDYLQHVKMHPNIPEAQIAFAADLIDETGWRTDANNVFTDFCGMDKKRQGTLLYLEKGKGAIRKILAGTACDIFINK